MSYALRTTLMIGAFWLLAISAGWYQVHFRMEDTRKELLTKESKIQEELELSEELASNLGVLQAELDSLKSSWENRSKAIPKTEVSYETYDYINDIIAKHPSTLNFDFTAGDVGDTAGIRSANYQMIGEAKFIDLYRFIWYLEHLPRYIRLNSLQLFETKNERQPENALGVDHWVRFELSLTAQSADRTGFDEVQTAGFIVPPQAKYDPFSSAEKIVVTVPANEFNLPNIFESTLKAMTPEEIYLMDQNGMLKVLSFGDAVYLGYLLDILPDENRAVFELDQLQPPRQVSLEIKTTTK